MANFSERSKRNLQGVHPHLICVLNEAILNTPLDFTIVCGVRTTEQQQALFAQGRTKPGNIVTNANGVRNKSNHQIKTDGMGHAIDFYPYYNGSLHVNAPMYMFEKIARHIQFTAKNLGFRVDWGGDWKRFKDYPHLEMKLNA